MVPQTAPEKRKISVCLSALTRSRIDHRIVRLGPIQALSFCRSFIANGRQAEALSFHGATTNTYERFPLPARLSCTLLKEMLATVADRLTGVDKGFWM
jgi:hypothetical protein